MKAALALVSGFVMTLAVFAGGFAAAAAMLWVDQPGQPARDEAVAGPWTTKAVRVDVASQDFERVAARLQPRAEPAPKADDAGTIDETTTASANDEARDGIEYASNSEQHVNWCSRAYRSYDRMDNSYLAYSGARRECISPYMEHQPTDVSAVRPVGVQLASSDGSFAFGGDDHVQSCLDRYRSYRPEDNSYQPYGGGPRQQCE